jgi:hypothetical protein
LGARPELDGVTVKFSQRSGLEVLIARGWVVIFSRGIQCRQGVVAHRRGHPPAFRARRHVPIAKRREGRDPAAGRDRSDLPADQPPKQSDLRLRYIHDTFLAG